VRGECKPFSGFTVQSNLIESYFKLKLTGPEPTFPWRISYQRSDGRTKKIYRENGTDASGI